MHVKEYTNFRMRDNRRDEWNLKSLKVHGHPLIDITVESCATVIKYFKGAYNF